LAKLQGSLEGFDLVDQGVDRGRRRPRFSSQARSARLGGLVGGTRPVRTVCGRSPTCSCQPAADARGVTRPGRSKPCIGHELRAARVARTDGSQGLPAPVVEPR